MSSGKGFAKMDDDAQETGTANQSSDEYQDEYLEPEQRSKWYPAPRTIYLLIAANVIMAAIVGVIIYLAVDKQNTNNATPAPTWASANPSLQPTKAPTISAAPSPSPSKQPSANPSMAPSTDQPSGIPSKLPSMHPSSVPSISPSQNPSNIASANPTSGPFTCDPCGPGKEMKNSAGVVDFGFRVTKECSIIQQEANDGLITEPNCEVLYDQIRVPCDCKPVTAFSRTAASVEALFQTVSPTANVTGTAENTASNYVINDDVFVQTTTLNQMTDAELIQRYILVLMHNTIFSSTATSCQVSKSSTTCAAGAPSTDEDCNCVTGTQAGFFWRTGFWECQWAGVSCTYGEVSGIDISSFNLAGDLPSATFQGFPKITAMDFSSNTNLGGSIPTDLGTSSLLTSLDVNGDSIGGSLPSELFSLGLLTNLNVASNSISGTISTQIGQLGNLVTLAIYGNSFNATLPSQIAGLSKLDSISVQGNNFAGGDIPVCSNAASLRPANIVGECSTAVNCTCCTCCADATVCL